MGESENGKSVDHDILLERVNVELNERSDALMVAGVVDEKIHGPVVVSQEPATECS
jgi:hypothetical protein